MWYNALIYNVPGSKIYSSARNLSELWESMFASIISKDKLHDIDRPPSVDQIAVMISDCHSLSAAELGEALLTLDALCPECLTKRIDNNEIEVNMDLVTGKAFRQVSCN